MVNQLLRDKPSNSIESGEIKSNQIKSTKACQCLSLECRSQFPLEIHRFRSCSCQPFARLFSRNPHCTEHTFISSHFWCIRPTFPDGSRQVRCLKGSIYVSLRTTCASRLVCTADWVETLLHRVDCRLTELSLTVPAFSLLLTYPPTLLSMDIRYFTCENKSQARRIYLAGIKITFSSSLTV